MSIELRDAMAAAVEAKTLLEFAFDHRVSINPTYAGWVAQRGKNLYTGRTHMEALRKCMAAYKGEHSGL